MWTYWICSCSIDYSWKCYAEHNWCLMKGGCCRRNRRRKPATHSSMKRSCTRLVKLFFLSYKVWPDILYQCTNVQSQYTDNSTSDYTLRTLYRSYSRALALTSNCNCLAWRAVDLTVNSTSDYTLRTMYRSYIKGISFNIELQVYSLACCWPYDCIIFQEGFS
jgi:hypothetical protein